ncbi:hypothetical protein GJW-30_1_00512 [Variibacter gotjawalensis]|uniref:Uncharacterized protein n=1 Tax=Variibacter gotjawalensis TaxID=1333996 RepID=A0A0S3PQ63_9BRAD|nr:hypothetical protein [Variibacter gotjawalensis]NIK48298.1 hypothetical protein [Variibacter gotjawalensis]RZS50170.1 hypothetical protein EV661_2622 [Variibacter gotjawalensis]BAT58000.1 hypothetical protein GJW-30_1_00512 [Variibacter gotjawalensis]
MRMLAGVVIAVLAGSPAFSDPLSDLTRGGRDACFQRVYDAAHLAKNPRQQVTTMTVWLNGKTGSMRGGNMGLSVTRRSDQAPLFLSGDCSWSTFDKPPEWVSTFRKRAGGGCVTSAVPDVFPDVSSAEEGGAMLLDPAPDGRSMMVHLDEAQSMVTRAKRGDAISLKFGKDDRVFRLTATDLTACDAIKDAVSTMEPK